MTQRQKDLKLVITFKTTTASMAMEAACTPEQGRLIPVPQVISAGCGLCWCAPLDLEQELTALIEQKGIDYAEKYIIPLY